MSENNTNTGLILFILFGVAIAGLGGYMYQKQQQDIQGHEPVEATILNTSVDRKASGRNANQKYYARVTYEYTVEGTTYKSENLRAGGIEKGFTSREAAWNFLEDYRTGDQVTAYYDPDNPSEAYLVGKTDNMLLVFAALGALIAIGGVRKLTK